MQKPLLHRSISTDHPAESRCSMNMPPAPLSVLTQGGFTAKLTGKLDTQR